MPSVELPPAFNWPAAVELADRHALFPLLGRALRRGGLAGIPRAAAAEIERRADAAARQALLLTAEMLRILDGLERAGVPALPYKGPALAMQAFGDPRLRVSGDLDFLTRPEDYPAARAALESLGYRQWWRLGRDQDRRFVAADACHVFQHERLQLVVELHWRLLHRAYALPLESRDLMARCRATDCLGAPIRTMSSEDTLIALCVHGAKHRWDRMSWIADVAALLWRRKRDDWPELADRAATLGVGRVLALGVGVARELMGCPVPEQLLQPTDSDTVRQQALGEIEARTGLSPYEPPGSVVEAGFYRRLMDRPMDRALFWPRWVLEPGRRDFAALPLPGWLFPLYRVARPARLAGRAAVGAARRMTNGRGGSPTRAAADGN